MTVSPSKFLRVGLTGGIASGKSTVARAFSKAGLPVIDADLLVRELSSPGGRAHGAIVSRFGTADRKALRERIYGNAEEKKALEAILHPLVQEESASRMKDLAAKGFPGVVYEAALLVEAGRAGDFDEVIVVEAPVDVRVDRLMARDGISREQALAIIHAQISDAERAKAATRILKNSAGVIELEDQVGRLVSEWFQK